MVIKNTNHQDIQFSMEDDLSWEFIFDNHTAVMLLVEPGSGQILKTNPAAVKFYGYPQQKLNGMPVSEIFCMPDEMLVIERQKAKNEGQNYLALTHQLASGEVRCVEELTTTIIWQHKPVLFLIIHDISERVRQPGNDLNLSVHDEKERHEVVFEDLQIHKMELEMQNEELRKTQIELETARALYSDLYDLAPVGYGTLSEDDLILETNRTAARLLKTTRADMLNEPFHRFIHPDQQSAYFQYCRQLFITRQALTLDVQLRKIDGSHFFAHLEARVGPVFQAGTEVAINKPIAARIMISDISEQKRAAELVLANKELAYQNSEKEKRAAEGCGSVFRRSYKSE